MAVSRRSTRSLAEGWPAGWAKDFRQFVRNLDAGPHASKKAWQSFAQGNSLKPVPQEAKAPREPWAAISVADLAHIESRIEPGVQQGGRTMPVSESMLRIPAPPPRMDARLSPPRPERQAGYLAPIEPMPALRPLRRTLATMSPRHPSRFRSLLPFVHYSSGRTDDEHASQLPIAGS
jgi:hypothetical protein